MLLKKVVFYGIRETGIAYLLAVSILAIPNVFAQQIPSSPAAQEAAQHQGKLQQIINDKAAFAAEIVSRWEEAARAAGRWDTNYAADLYVALMKLQPDNLLAASEATSYQAMMTVLATGRPVPAISLNQQSSTISPNALGDVGDDLVFTPLTPCRIVDTRNAGGIIAANTTRSFDMDGSSFGTQGGFNGSCGVPFGVARAVAMTITSTGSDGVGYFTAWSVGSSQPFSSVLNFAPGQNIANTTIVPVDPGAGTDFNLYAGGADSQAVIDVVGYFAAPVATALDCITVASPVGTAQVDVWLNVDASCPAGRTATGGGYFDPNAGSLGTVGVWLYSLPNGNGWRTWVDNQTNGPRTMQTFVNCCRIPGR